MKQDMLCLLAVLAGLPLSTPARADGPAEALLDRCRAATGQLGSLRAEYTVDIQALGERQQMQGWFAARRPGLYHEEERLPSGKRQVFHSDGRTALLYYEEAHRYQRLPVSPGQAHWTVGFPAAARLFFAPGSLADVEQRLFGCPPALAGMIAIDGVPCRVVEFRGRGRFAWRIRYYIGPDHLLRGYREETASSVREARLRGLQADTPLPSDAFAWSLPQDARRATDD